MGVQGCFLAVEKTAPIDAVLRAAANFVSTVDDPPTHSFVWLQPAAQAVELRWFGLLGQQRRHYPIDALTESLACDLPHFVAVLHDDQQGVYLFERYVCAPGASDTTCELSIVSDGPYLGVARGTLTLDYPQRGFTIAELAALGRKPEAELSEREARAVLAYANAASVGLAQTHPADGRAYLDARRDAEMYPLVGSEHRRISIPPAPLVPIVRSAPSDAHWDAAGLPRRQL